MNGMAASDKSFALLDLPEPEKKEGRISCSPAEICMTDVYFSYPSGERPGREILSGIQLEFPAGSFTSLVGTSGCGKSTVAGILMGRNRGCRGSVQIGGQEVSSLSEESRMEHVTMVTHNSYLFKGTVEENLHLGKPDAAREEMEEALEKVNLPVPRLHCQ